MFPALFHDGAVVPMTEQGLVIQNLEQVARTLVQARYVTALVGAGMSVESGIPPFRGPGGLWVRYGEPPMNGFELFLQDPRRWWEATLEDEDHPSRREMRGALEQAQPNPGHYALVDLETMGVLRYVISQNVDNLHITAGTQNLAEIHGNRTKVRCLGCSLRFLKEEFPILNLPPKCPECGELMKGDGVMFGEPIPEDVLKVCFEQSELSDCMIILGTSAVVYPAASLPLHVKQRGGLLVEVNMFNTPLTDQCDLVLRGPPGGVLTRLVERIRELKSQ